MFDAWYNRITKDSNLKFQIGMSDTDSFLFKVSDGPRFREHVREIMDYSNYPPNHRDFNDAHKSELGYFKDEFCGKFKCLEFVGLRSKCYAMNLTDLETKTKTEKKVCKGLGRSAIANKLHFDKYKDCLLNHVDVRETFHSIRSVKHNLQTVSITKKALSFVDTKRWLLKCAIHSFPYGSIQIQQYYDYCPICKI